jgi:hypothetical protein
MDIAGRQPSWGSDAERPCEKKKPPGGEAERLSLN